MVTYCTTTRRSDSVTVPTFLKASSIPNIRFELSVSANLSNVRQPYKSTPENQHICIIYCGEATPFVMSETFRYDLQIGNTPEEMLPSCRLIVSSQYFKESKS